MSELALQLIEKEKKEKTGKLDLGNCGLTEIPEEVFELTWLEELSFSERYMDVELNRKVLTENIYSKNSLNKIHYNVCKLVNLKKLILLGSISENTSINIIANISNLKLLKYLDIGDNYINDIYFLSNLRELEILILRDNNINDLSSLENCSKLSYLDIGSNKITNIASLGNLRKIKYLDLFDNNISDIQPVENLQCVSELFLSSNKIIDISPLKYLSNLENLELSANQISDIGSLLFLLRKGLSIDMNFPFSNIIIGDNPIVTPPIDIVKKGREFILEYYGKNTTPEIANNPKQVLEDSQVNPVLNVEKTAKIIVDIIGEIDSKEVGLMFGLFGKWGRGKTFLWERICNYINKEEKKFHIIKFHAWLYQETPASWAYLYEKITESLIPKPVDKGCYQKLNYWNSIFRLNIKRNGLTPLLKYAFVLISTFLVSFISYCIKQKVGVDYNFFDIDQIAIIFAGISSIIALISKERGRKAIDLFKKYTSKHSYKNLLGFQSEIQSELKILINFWADNKSNTGKKIILFVDDIDRCSEERIIQVVDALRVLLEDDEISKRLIVILAVDETILKRAITHKYNGILTSDEQKQKNLKKLTREYIDKLFILGIKLGGLNESEKIEVFNNYAKKDINPISQKKPAIYGPVGNVIEILPENKTEESEIVGNTTANNFLKNKRITTVPLFEQANKEDSINKLFSLSSNQIKEEYIITESEKEHIEQYLRNDIDITPREIRIFYHRYLLAKNILFNVKLTKGEIEAWIKIEIDEGLLIALILEYSIIREIEDLKKYKNIISNDNSVDITMVMMKKTFTVERIILFKLLEVVEIVVPY